ncbi:putative hydro-lyase [Pseudonocardia sp. NPDC049635]|uniref:putative hydro-lyase n=1 Tax=Pseudonocardia sp. NPDC049635 TaxID=3155506 RepID=UPI0033C9E7DB
MSTTSGLTPAQARARFRGGLVTTTSGWCAGWTQVNLIAVPREYAWDVLLFAQRNPKPCPVLDVLEPREFAGALFDGDVRTDLPRYRVYVDGELVERPTDVREHWRGDLVTFLIGCSFTFENALLTERVPVRHLEQGGTVPMYRTTRRCRSAGRMSGPLVVSMRPVPAALVDTAVSVTARYPDVHGSPVHVGDPASLGITDLDRPDHGDPVRMTGDDVPVFWACGVTPQAAVLESRLPLAITHEPGHMLVTDTRDTDYLI